MAHRSTARAALSACIAGVLLAATVVAAGAQTQTAARDITRFACPPELIDAGFSDVEGNTHETAITCLATYGITQGTSATRYSPSQFVRRGQMASFLFRLLEFQGVPMDTEDQGFVDVAGHTHEESINGIASLDVARGRTATRFAPQELITRGEMATFLFRSAALFGPPLAAGTDAFDDDNGSSHEAAVNAVAAAGIAQGTGSRRFDPNGAVTRAAMAAFITRFLDWGIEQNIMFSFAGEDIGLAALSPGEVVGGGTTGAAGSIWLSTIGQEDVLCYELLVDELDPNGAVGHIHKAAAGTNATTAVVTLPAPLAPNPEFPISDAAARRCVEVDAAVLDDITNNPESYYADVHTTAAAGGAVRGQLGRIKSFFVAEMFGDEVVPTPGDPDGFGVAVLMTTSQPDDLCYSMLTGGTDAPTGAAVHRGAAGSAGQSVIPLKTPQTTPIEGIHVSGGCNGDVDTALLTELETSPGGFYVSVSDGAHPGGALRGQLTRETLQTRAAGFG